MRLNRGTILLIAALLVVIVVVLVINNTQQNAPTPTPTVAEASGPLLPNLVGADIAHYEVRDNTSGEFTALLKDDGGAWDIDATNALPGRDPDQDLINTTAGQLAVINYSSTFQDDQLATFGLDHPSYTILVTSNDGKLNTVYIGAKSPTSARYYAVVMSGTPAEATAEATTESGAAPQAVATENVANGSGSAAATESVSAATAEATIEALGAATAEATSEATAEATPESTADVIHNPQITLSGQQTIYLIPQTVIDTLKAWIPTPPYAPIPTPGPTEEATAEATLLLEEGANPALIPAGTPLATQGATQEVTPETTATAEATAAP